MDLFPGRSKEVCIVHDTNLFLQWRRVVWRPLHKIYADLTLLG